MSSSSTHLGADLLPLSFKKSGTNGCGTASEGISLAPEQASDEELMSLLQGKNRDAMACLFKRYGRVVRAIGLRILRDRAEAEDHVQEVFLYVFHKSSVFDSSKGTARSWLIQVAYTQAFLRRRKLKSLGFYELTTTQKECSAAPRAAYDQTVEGLFGRSGWREVLGALTEEQRETLRLHFFEGYTFAEIADKLRQSYANVRNHHYRGLERLRQHLAENRFNRRL